MICDSCQKKIYVKEPSIYSCQRCGRGIKSTHNGGYKYCFKCSNLLDVCQKCGKAISSKGTARNYNPFCKVCDCVDCLYKGSCVLGNCCNECKYGTRVKNCPIKNGKEF